MNQKQQEAIEHREGPALVLAGAGSGKTYIIVERIVRLLATEVPPHNILAVTFTNKAAKEMGERVSKRSEARVYTTTFHSLGARILRESAAHGSYAPSFVIYDQDDCKKLVKECLKLLGIKEDAALLKKSLSRISLIKNSLDPSSEKDQKFISLYNLYKKKLEDAGAFDFDDLLCRAVELLQNNQERLAFYQNLWRYIMVDEYQDTNGVQNRLVELLSREHRNVFVVGDPDQSIYSWRGANVQSILQFSKLYQGARVITLEQNYRSTSTILDASNTVISRNRQRFKKNLWGTKGDGEKISLFQADNERSEALFVADQIEQLVRYSGYGYQDIAVLYRTNAQSRAFEDFFLKKNIPHIIVGELSFYLRKEIKDFFALLRLGVGCADPLSVVRSLNIPNRSLGETSINKLVTIAHESNIPLLTICEQAAEGLLTISLQKKQLQGLSEYVRAVALFRAEVSAQPPRPLSFLLQRALELFSFFRYLQEDPETESGRKENILALLGKAAEWECDNVDGTLLQFLEELSLKPQEILEGKPKIASVVRLMTLHNGKGLEFPVVFLVGLEESLFPSMQALTAPDTLEEERRLFYVGMTRAKERLLLSSARERFVWGGARSMSASRFIGEIPSHYLEKLSVAQAFR